MDTGPDLTFRPASGEADAVAASLIIHAALSDLHVKRGQSPLEGPGDGAAPVLAHLMRTDPGAFWIAADADGRPVAFGAGMSRPGLWFLSGLFVLPAYQGKGLGRRLIELAKGEHPLPDEVAALTSSAANPISNRLYAQPRHLSAGPAADHDWAGGGCGDGQDSAAADSPSRRTRRRRRLRRGHRESSTLEAEPLTLSRLASRRAGRDRRRRHRRRSHRRPSLASGP